jgi:teichuronic acid biosynthesis glycosyltransferase TuaH
MPLRERFFKMRIRGGERPPIGDEIVVVIAGTSWDGIWMPERHVVRHLARRIPVLWVDPPISYLTPLREREALAALREHRLRPVAPNILRLSPIALPGVTRPLVRGIAAPQVRHTVRRAVESLGASVHSTIVASPTEMLDLFPSARRVFYGTDDFVAGARLTGTGAGWLQRRTRRLLLSADTVVVSSPQLKEKWSKYRGDISVVPNGCDVEHFARVDEAPLPSDVTLPPPIAGFVGHMSERIDPATLEAVAASGVSLLLVGPRQPTFDISRLRPIISRPNVQWVGPKEFEELPSYLRVIDVGLTPYAQSDFNAASFPLKTLEYLAAGRPAVASDLPAHRWLASPHITIAPTPSEFSRQTRALLDAPRRPDDVRGRQAFAARHSWRERTSEMSRILGLNGSRPSLEKTA